MWDPDLEIRGGGGGGGGVFRPFEKGGGRGAKKNFGPFGPQFGLKIKGVPRPPGPLP